MKIISYLMKKNVVMRCQKNLLKAISYLSKEYYSKSAIWYRNFLIKKFKPENKDKIPNHISRNKNNLIDDRFYYTYLSDAVLKKPIDYKDFIQEKEKKLKYFKYYTILDKELKTQTRLYGLDTNQYHKLKEEEANNIYTEGMGYLQNDKKNLIST